MENEHENTGQWGGLRDGAGRLNLYREHPETKQKTITLPVEFLDEMEAVYRPEYGRNWASLALYDFVKEWYDERMTKPQT